MGTDLEIEGGGEEKGPGGERQRPISKLIKKIPNEPQQC